ncbi:unnamed protein product [Larinioides sclopetarius]|uniref:Uncharacterized protein n=1 Tax=Larinioides sclopetarius TaxID=280406 RepID=A0AAV1ZLQ7_9ARAC
MCGFCSAKYHLPGAPEVHFTEDQFENHRADKRRLLKQTAVRSIFSHRLLQNSRKPSTYVLLKDSINASFSVDFSLGDKNGNDDDQVSEEAPKFEDVQSENVLNAIENLFSTVRLKSPVPICKEFKTFLRLIILSHYFTSGVKGNSLSDTDEEMGIPILQLYSESKNSDAQEFSNEKVINFDI